MSAQTVVEVRPHTNAILVALAETTEKPAGDAERPVEGAGWLGEPGDSDFEPYSVLVLDDVALSGPLGDAQADATLRYRVVAVGVTREQAEWLSDKVRKALTKTNISEVGIPDRRVMGTVWTGTSGTQRDDSVRPPLYYVSNSYTVMTTPQGG